jgi:hypothetical protein
MVMKRSTIIKKALNHTLNTVCVNEEQVERMLAVFEKLGMLPPFVDQYDSDTSLDLIGNRWEEEDEEK